MSLLQQNPSLLDGAGPGDEVTKGSTRLVWAALAAAVVVSIAIAIYMIAGQRPPASTGEATRAVAHFMHRETAGFDANGAPMPKQDFDQVLLFTHLKLRNQSKLPLFLREITANAILDDGVHSSYAATPTDYERLFAAYKDLAPLHGKSLAIEETIAPGDTVEGDFVSSFRMTKAEWEARKGLDYTVNFRYQPEMKVKLPTPVTEQ